MKHFSCNALLLAGICAMGISLSACKSKSSTSGSSDTTATSTQQQPDTTTATPAPVVVSADDSLTAMAKDATKDYPGVTATVNNGVVTLSGDITRAKLPKLMMAINAMHPKKVTNNLTIK